MYINCIIWPIPIYLIITHKEDYKNLQKHYRTIVTQENKELPEIPEKPSGQRDTMAK